MRDGRARLHQGVDEAVLSPHAARAAGVADPQGRAPRWRRRRAGPGRSRSARRRRRRQARSAATRELQKKVERLERDLGRAENDVADLQRQLADPELYEDNDKVKLLVAAHDEAKDRAASLMDQWLEAQGALDRAEARFA